jgi:hypothetical protein
MTKYTKEQARKNEEDFQADEDLIYAKEQEEIRKLKENEKKLSVDTPEVIPWSQR